MPAKLALGYLNWSKSSDGGKFPRCLKFLPRLVKKIFFAHPDHDEEKDTIKRIKGQKSACRQEETRRGRQEEIDFLGEDEGYRGQGEGHFGQSSPGENTENQIQGCCVQILESRKNRAQTSAPPSVNVIGGGREQGT